MNVNADKADVSQTGVSIFTGKVEMERADQRLNADRLEYNRDTEQAVASGNIKYLDNSIELKGPEISMDLVRDTGNIKQAEYQLFDRHASGKADNIDRDSVANIT
ncbi:MAG TPA: LptA/OstA family protein, partial [Desulfurivibrionaceae bacterium]|nr:LptA/OstA family protein [Desulfurivibrionaceae bacterium]